MVRLPAFLGGLLLGMVAAMSPAGAPAPRFDDLVVIGDSLSDIGNAGRFSNGPVWVEYLARRLGIALQPARTGGRNFAVGGAQLDPGAGPFGLRAQADLYLGTGAPRGRTLHVVFGGGNDLLAALGDPDGAARVDRAASALAGILGDLAARGATDILVPNLPDIGITPAVRAHGSAAAAEARRLSARFNDKLERVLAGLAAAGAPRLHRLDVWALAERVRADPAAAGFAPSLESCGGGPGCADRLFWDHVHPTTAAHARLAEAAYRALGGAFP